MSYLELEAHITAIIDLHPLRKTISVSMQREKNAAMPMELAEMTVNASGGSYEKDSAMAVGTIEKENSRYNHRGKNESANVVTRNLKVSSRGR